MFGGYFEYYFGYYLFFIITNSTLNRQNMIEYLL